MYCCKQVEGKLFSKHVDNGGVIYGRNASSSAAIIGVSLPLKLDSTLPPRLAKRVDCT